MFINALEFDTSILKTASDEMLKEYESYFYTTQVGLMNIQQAILKEIQSIPGWKTNQDLKNILIGLDGTSARKNEYLPMFGVAGDRKDYVNLWHLAQDEIKAREEARKTQIFIEADGTQIWTVIQIKENHFNLYCSSRVQVTTKVVGVFTSYEKAQEVAKKYTGNVRIVRSLLNSTLNVDIDEPITRYYGHTE